MTRNYNVTGEDRKQMVQIISREVGVQAVYTRMPECAYVIDNIKVSKTGELIWDERTDDEAIEKITAALETAGFTAEELEEAEETAETEETGDAAEADEGEENEPLHLDGISFSFPKADFTDAALENLKAIIASKQTLIKKALQADNLNIEIEDKVTFPWWERTLTPEEINAYGEFLARLVKMAKEAKRVTATERATESEKYTFRTFLLRLGFIGAEHKHTRAILMEHLSGHAAFKNQADADAFYQKLKERKAAEKSAAIAAEEADAEDEEEEEEEDDEISE